MAKIFYSHIEALKYMLENPGVNKIQSSSGLVYHCSEFGVVTRGDGKFIYIDSLLPPLKTVEQEKPNDKYINEIENLIKKQTPDVLITKLLERVLEIMDEKIKKAVKK